MKLDSYSSILPGELVDAIDTALDTFEDDVDRVVEVVGDLAVFESEAACLFALQGALVDVVEGCDRALAEIEGQLVSLKELKE